ncbi:MAG: PAC2 family protein [Methanomassiliicoccales archaeon]
MDEIRVVELKEMDLRGAYVIDGFPSVGLVGSIAANYLIKTLPLELIGVIDSEFFPAISWVKDGTPFGPVRIYGGESGEDKVAIFVSEFQPPVNLIRSLATTMMDWFEDHKCGMVISPEGLIVQTGSDESENVADSKSGSDALSRVWGIGSTARANEILKSNGIQLFENGVIVGLAATLLNEGVYRDLDVLLLLSEARADYPDARAAAAVTAAIDKILLHTEIDVRPLLDEAVAIEEKLKEMYKRAGKKEELSRMRSIMYG